jgi:mono/diheme cytochrome c family protein
MKLLCALILPLAIAASAASAAGDRVEASRGQALAQLWCTQCHAVKRGEVVGPFADVPSFTAVAALPSTTAAALHAFLTTPHGDMPDFKLTPTQLDDLIEYILSLRQP